MTYFQCYFVGKTANFNCSFDWLNTI